VNDGIPDPEVLQCLFAVMRPQNHLQQAVLVLAMTFFVSLAFGLRQGEKETCCPHLFLIPPIPCRRIVLQFFDYG